MVGMFVVTSIAVAAAVLAVGSVVAAVVTI